MGVGELKIVIVHDYLNQLGGAERVVAVLHEMFPNAPIYTLLLNSDKLWPSLRNANIVPSFLSKFRLVNKYFKLFFWLYPLAMKTINVEGFDLVISSSSAYAKAVKVSKPGQIHVCYCHTPMRFAWNFDQYISNETSFKILRFVAKRMVPLLKRWDKRSARDVDVFIANSTVVAERIRKIYERESRVIFPPVELSQQHPRNPRDYFLIVSRLVAYKRIDMAVEACNLLGAELVIIGDGPDMGRLKQISGPHVTFLGFQPTEVVIDYLSTCQALVFPGEEDFGMTPVEAHAQGCPVVAYRAGGALDTIIEGVNGLFFDRADANSLAAVLDSVKNYTWDVAAIRNTAERFSRDRFEKQLYQCIEQVMTSSLASELSSKTISEGIVGEVM